MLEEETRKQLAVGSDEPGFTFRTSFDPFNLIMQQLGRLDTKFDDLRKDIDAKTDRLDTKFGDLRKDMDAKTDRLDAKIDKLSAKIDVRVDGLHQELHSTTRWIIGTLVTVLGVAVALMSWLFR